MKGLGAHRRRLKKLTNPQAMQLISKALYNAGEKIQVEAQLSITRGSISGKDHVASLPGQPPNQDTGVLANNIETVQKGPLLVEISSNAPYAAALEFGTSKMGERPYMRPARDKMRGEVTEFMVKAVKKAVKMSRA